MKDLLQQFTALRFGIFIHYGLYSIPGGIWKVKAQGRNAYAEWIKYQALWPDGGPRNTMPWPTNSLQRNSIRRHGRGKSGMPARDML